MNKPIFIVVVVVSFMMLGPSLNNAFADILPPKKQMKLSFSSNEIICKEGLIRITNANDQPACVNISSVNKLVKFGCLTDNFIRGETKFHLFFWWKNICKRIIQTWT
jgi:hypothetical protein